MNYEKHYDLLVFTRMLVQEERQKLRKIRRKTKELVPETYFESHHIIPTCLNGSNEKENLILFTAREHYVAHWLLSKIYPKHPGLINAQFRLTNDKQNNHIKINSRKYQLLKEENSEVVSKQMSGENHPNFGKKGKDHPGTGYKHTKIALSLIGDASRGENNTNFGKKGKDNHRFNCKHGEQSKKLMKQNCKRAGSHPNFGIYPWETNVCISRKGDYGWSKLDLIYNKMITDKIGYVKLWEYFTKTNKKIQNSKSSFQHMVQWLRKNGNPTNHTGWLDFKKNYNN